MMVVFRVLPMVRKPSMIRRIVTLAWLTVISPLLVSMVQSISPMP